MARTVAGTLLLPNGQPLANARIYFVAKRTEAASILEGVNASFSTNASGVYSQSIVNGYYSVSIEAPGDSSGTNPRRYGLGDAFVETAATTTLEALLIASNPPDDTSTDIFYQILADCQQAAEDAQAAADAAASSAATIDPSNFATAAQGAKADSAIQPATLNARLGTTENLGTAAQQNTEAFATAAQGAKADSAIQTADLNARLGTTGNLGTAAQQNSGAFATADQGTKADSAIQPTTLNTRLGTTGNLGTLAQQNANAVVVAGGSVDGTTIGATTRAAGNFNNVDANGNLNFTGTGRKITADFSNATFANRASFQSSVVNGNTNVQAIPNGSSVVSQFISFGASDPANANFGALTQVGSATRIQNGYSGSATAGAVEIWASGSAQAVMSASGNMGFGVTSPDTSCRIQSANGIKLGNTANASSVVLDYYERGTFTPTVVGLTTTGAATYSVRNGQYQRVGNRVHFQINLTWTGHTGTGSMRINGLPFSSFSGGGNAVASVYRGGFAVSVDHDLQVFLSPGGTSIDFDQVSAAGSTFIVSVPAAGTLIISGSYGV